MHRSSELEEIKINYNPEIVLLLLCCRVFLKTAWEDVLRIFIQQNEIEWKKVYQLSRVHRIRPVVFSVLNTVKEVVDKDVLEQFYHFCRRLTSLSFNRKLEADRILNILHEKAIRAKLYKGVDFAILAYGDIGMREFTDNDVIIEKKDLPAIINVMDGEGYEMKEGEFYNRFPKKFLRIHKDIVFYKKMINGKTIAFEFHFGPIQYFSLCQESFAELIGEDYLSSERVYDNKDYFKLMLINNGAADYFPDLRSLLDLTIIYKNASAILPVNKNEPDRFILLWHSLSSRFFNLPIEFGYTLDKPQCYIRDYLFNKILKRPGRKRIIYLRYCYFNILFSDGLKAKWHQLLRSVHFLISPNGNDIGALKLPYYFLYYFIKPFRLLFNLFSNSSTQSPASKLFLKETRMLSKPL